MTEPDVILLGTNGIAVIECKLGESDKSLSHLWEGSDASVNKRIVVYSKEIPALVKTRDLAQLASVYQLIRMAFYSFKLGEHFNLAPVLVSISNKHNWKIKIRMGGLNKTPAEFWNHFQKDILGDKSLRCKKLYWQDILDVVRGRSTDTLYDYLEAHPCLQMRYPNR